MTIATMVPGDDLTEDEFKKLVEDGAVAFKIDKETGFIEGLTVEAIMEFFETEGTRLAEHAYKKGYMDAAKDMRQLMHEQLEKQGPSSLVDDDRRLGGYL